ncbi:MAG: hypothetical protein U1A16_03065 [Patescibacteria group bacterium]|nr:hypothetical protein [Patescibacteria group bacterium]
MGASLLSRWSFIGDTVTGLLLVVYGSFLVHKVNLVTADLGRHLKNGELFIERLQIPRTNHYSFTEPDFPVVTHHWASGALFYLFFKLGGFAGVELFFIALSLAAFLLFFAAASRAAGWGVAALCALLVIPLLAERTEIRPEAFSYLFAALFFALLVRVRDGALRRRWLLVLPLLEVFWVNTHIYFFLGPAIVGAFALEALVRARLPRALTQAFVGVLALTASAAFLNPFGFRGVLEPLTILRDYGYRLAENQPVWFLETLMQNPNFTIFKVVFGLVLLSFLFRLAAQVWFRREARPQSIPSFVGATPCGLARPPAAEAFPVALFCLALGVSAMAWLQVRNFTLFGFFALPILSANIASAFPLLIRDFREELRMGALALAVLAVLAASSGGLQRVFPYWREFGLGLEAANSAAADFFRTERLAGPIMNNYDIGGSLIFHFFPRERVFVDNRPEAYSVAFFQETYIPIQESAEKWRTAEERYNFNAIIFSHRDATPWGQQFLISRVNDPKWVPVFVDEYAIIFVKNVEQNRQVIERHAIPRERFGVVQRTQQ